MVFQKAGHADIILRARIWWASGDALDGGRVVLERGVVNLLALRTRQIGAAIIHASATGDRGDEGVCSEWFRGRRQNEGKDEEVVLQHVSC